MTLPYSDMEALRPLDIFAALVGISALYDLTPSQWPLAREEVGLTAMKLSRLRPLCQDIRDPIRTFAQSRIPKS